MAILKITTDGDPYPVRAGRSTLSTAPVNSGPDRKFFGQNQSIADQSKVYNIEYRGGTGGKIRSDGTFEIFDGDEEAVDLNQPVGITTFGVPIYSSGVKFAWASGAESYPQYNWDSMAGQNRGSSDSRFEFDLCDGASETIDREYRYRGNSFFNSGMASSNDLFKNSSTYYTENGFNSNYLAHGPITDGASPPTTLFTGGHSKIIGFAFDGYPIYGPFAYSTATDGTSSVVRMTSGYRLYTDSEMQIIDPTRYADLPTYEMGTFVEDYTFDPDGVQSNLNISNPESILDKHNGRFCVTPDYKQGTYAYFLTETGSSVPAYPYIIGPSTKQRRTY